MPPPHIRTQGKDECLPFSRLMRSRSQDGKTNVFLSSQIALCEKRNIEGKGECLPCGNMTTEGKSEVRHRRVQTNVSLWPRITLRRVDNPRRSRTSPLEPHR